MAQLLRVKFITFKAFIFVHLFFTSIDRFLLLCFVVSKNVLLGNLIALELVK